MQVKDLSPPQCILLAVHFATESNIKALHTFTPARHDALDPELVLRILLTYLPETVAPAEYVSYVREVGTRLYLDVERKDVRINTSPVADLSPQEAQKKVAQLKLRELAPPVFPPHAPTDPLTRFLCHRAYRIDEETGLLSILPQLIEPFLDRNEFIRSWYISVVLPLLRVEFEYYPEDEQGEVGLKLFEEFEGKKGIDFLLAKAGKIVNYEEEGAALGRKSRLARDIKGLVGPWMYGHTDRKRRRLNPHENDGADDRQMASISDSTRRISLSGVTKDDKTGHDWEYCYRWLVFHSRTQFPLVTHAIEEWDGPGDIDLGDLEKQGDAYLDEETQGKLELQYAQAAFASCYAVEADTESTIRGAHGILARLAELLDFIPPPDLASSVDSLPKLERHATALDESRTVKDLLPDALLSPEHPLTTPRLETYMLLQMMVYSAYQFNGLGYPISIVNVAKLYFYASSEEQTAVFQKILRGMTKVGKKDDAQWTSEKARLIWLWNWGLDAEDESTQTGLGVLGKINRQVFDEEMLKIFVDLSNYELAARTYITSSGTTLSKENAEQAVLAKAYEAYDAATNGNKTRGAVKKANDIVNAFKPYFPGSAGFQQLSALINATHALSFYSLKLQRGVPFQPVSIRAAQDPVGLLRKVLEQNPGAYTKVEDLCSIGRNLVAAGLPTTASDGAAMEDDDEQAKDIQQRAKNAERTVTFMAVEAALKEDDFETAYSYIVSRLTPSPNDIEAPRDQPKTHKRVTSRGGTVTGEEDDISWRAALLAGRYRPAASAPPTLRRLEQRTELLSLALLLAPKSALTEILAVWRRCEEETSALRAEQAQAEQEFDDRADKRLSGGALPGTFGFDDSQPELVLNQRRREVGRMHSGKGDDEVPVSMFDLTRSAARAFSRNAFPLRSAAGAASAESHNDRSEEVFNMNASTGSFGSGSGGSDGLNEAQQRVRKRDMVANAASGALASGLGWMLGAAPANQHEG